MEISLKPQENALKFTAGQYIFIQFKDKNIGMESHPFTLSSSPGESELRFAAKNLGDYTSRLEELKVGSEALIEGPFGVFSYKRAINKSQIWLAGGVGITPFLPMIKTIPFNEGYQIDLFYCVKNNVEMIYLDELQQISKNNGDSFRLHLFCSEKQGRINADHIESEVKGGLKQKDIFICAPPLMIKSIKDQFLKKGMNKECIHSEEFNF